MIREKEMRTEKFSSQVNKQIEEETRREEGEIFYANQEERREGNRSSSFLRSFQTKQEFLTLL